MTSPNNPVFQKQVNHVSVRKHDAEVITLQCSLRVSIQIKAIEARVIKSSLN